uniref:Secreted protein n=1 Tax=Micrurus paraensis TaxID=1970185 RepID=A0A2D4KAP6_9SAUR
MDMFLHSLILPAALAISCYTFPSESGKKAEKARRENRRDCCLQCFFSPGYWLILQVIVISLLRILNCLVHKSNSKEQFRYRCKFSVLTVECDLVQTRNRTHVLTQTHTPFLWPNCLNWGLLGYF